MAQIIPKLNLNKTPAIVESNSLIFAKNIRLDVNGTIHKDYGVFPMSIHKRSSNSNLINYDNILTRIIADIALECDTNENVESYYNRVLTNLKYISGKTYTTSGEYRRDEITNGKYNIIGIISNSNEFFIFIHGTYIHTIHDIVGGLESVGTSFTKNVDLIIRYDEKEDKFYPCNCNWTWSGGKIDGCVINNLLGEKILTIGEYNTLNLVPIKCINFSTSKITDDESIYTQVPTVPLTNLSYKGTFSYIIPNGVYQFFVRYKIRKDFYTNWFPASHDIFVGNKNNTITSFGTLSYTNIHRDSDNSFVLSVEHLIKNAESNYEGFQLGFIVSHDGAMYARGWKHFKFNITTIQFDYKAEDSEELEVTDFLKPIYGLYNVGNITTFKNRLYISNYTETDFNDSNLQKFANDVDITLTSKTSDDNYAGYNIITAPVAGNDVINGLIIDNQNKYFTGINGLFYDIINSTENGTNSLASAIEYALDGSYDPLKTLGGEVKLYGIAIKVHVDSLDYAQDSFEDNHKDINTATTIVTNKFDYGNDEIDEILVNDVNKELDEVIPFIYNTPRYLNNNAQWIDESNELNDSIKIVINRKVTVTTITTLKPGSGPWLPTDPDIDNENEHTTIFDTTYPQNITIEFKSSTNEYNKTNSPLLTNYTTLIPYQKYKFYIHFVKSNGEITNGYYCSKAGELEAPYKANCDSVIYPIFNNITIPEDYVACFFSIVHTKTKVSTLFNINPSSNNVKKEASCIDVSMMLCPGYKNIHIKQGISIPVTDNKDENTEVETTEITTSESTDIPIDIFTGQYYDSSDSTISRYFGADGIIVFDAKIDGKSFVDNKLAYIINDYSIPESDNIELVKCTPYLNRNNTSIKDKKVYFDDYTKMNLLGYICNITPLDKDRCIDYYNDGSTVYYKELSSDSGNTLSLKELGKYINSKYQLATFNLKTSNAINVYSNYNLNYVALSEEPKLALKTYYDRDSENITAPTETQQDSSGIKLLRLIPSQTMSGIYELPEMYKSYIRKTFSVYKENETTRFENTVRSSILYGDESNINILTFDANDYYNIPTNKGIIVNLVAIGDAILVHTKDSMFKFSGSNTLQSSEGDIQQVETKPFDTGVTELFGSDFGFAGIQNKEDHIITENGYIFFDRDSRIVYLYSGQGQIARLSEYIEKLFRHKDIESIRFANDYYNNRFFMSIMFYKEERYIENGENKFGKQYYPVTLSFNTSEKTKSFVSLHDFYFNYAFNTKTNCYFLTNDNKDICVVNKNYKGLYPKLGITKDKTYPQHKENTILFTYTYNPDSNITQLKELNVTKYNSIVDIIVNDNFEIVKTLNAVNWCGTKIVNEFENINEEDIKTLMVAEDKSYETPCSHIRIYTDTCMTPLNDCTERSNNSSISSINSYKYPRYNQGYWTFNYFRNILNSKGHILTSNYSGDNNSLIEGKYFVVRFVFDSDFKFETLTLNYNVKQ